MPELRIHLGDVFAETGLSLTVTESVAAAALDVGPVRFDFLGPVSVDIKLENVGGLVLVRGKASATARVDCVRCLEPFTTDLEADIDAYLVQPGQEDGLPDDVDLEVVSGAWVDLWPSIGASLAEAAPFAPLHDEHCRGICASCGSDLNVTSCGCSSPEPTSPFSVLADLLPDEEA